jgi:hypothetical protein
VGFVIAKWKVAVVPALVFGGQMGNSLSHALMVYPPLNVENKQCIKYYKINIMTKTKQSKHYTKVAKEVCAAYNEETRNLQFRASHPVSVDEAVKIMTKALDISSEEDEGYNIFSPSLLRKLPKNSEVILAREGSVCVYVKGAFAQPKKMENDEFNYYPETMNTRLWWD